ncbi:hypothetical protein F383_35364 [Gossypium arboreum]|uniref:Uncharacterized protein n=1 Tax=Gossypium arboreum TaxID=29729 RepID=A0A0B0PXH1_GOSAR|nr:hypothetical protein F383_35364 [Gossypium arboreum]
MIFDVCLVMPLNLFR